MSSIQAESQNQAEYELQPQEYGYETTLDLALVMDLDDQHQEEMHPEEPQQSPSAAMETEPHAQQTPQYGHSQAPPDPAYTPQPAYSRPQHTNAVTAIQPVPFPPQSPQPLHLQQSPQPHVYTNGSSQPQNFGAAMHGYQQAPPQPGPFPPAAGVYHGVPIPPHKPMEEYWSSGLFDCMKDPNNALITACFPCITFGQVAEIVDRGHTTSGTSGLLYGVIACLTALPCILSCTYRTKMRNMYGLYESPAPDWIVHCLCEWCALCQEYRELQARGLDPTIGWSGNVARSQGIQMQNGAMVPPGSQSMIG